MPKSTRKPAAASPDVSAMATALMAGNPAIARMWLDIINESARFVSDRLRENLEAQQAMLQCKSPVEMARLQSEFFRTAIEQYTDESQRLFAIVTDAAGEAASEARSLPSRGYDDVPL